MIDDREIKIIRYRPKRNNIKQLKKLLFNRLDFHALASISYTNDYYLYSSI